MFLIDTLLVSGLRWTLETVRTAADSELHDDGALRQRLLEAEMRRELGEIGDEEFRTIETDVLARLRALKEQRGGEHALAFGRAVDRSAGEGLTVEATVAGDFHAAAVIQPVAPVPGPVAPARRARAVRPLGAARPVRRPPGRHRRGRSGR